MTAKEEALIIKIFIILKTESGWSKPMRLPRNVNTPFREESVQIHPDGKTLYFSVMVIQAWEG